MLKRLLKILVGVAILIAVAALAVQIVLSTDLPRRLALDALRDQTGLRVDAADLRAGWDGSTTATDVKLWLPLEPEPVLTVPELRVTHAGLLKLAFLRKLDLNRIVLIRPTLRARRDEEGRWNVVEAIDLIRSRREREGDGDADLPDVIVQDGAVEIMRGAQVAHAAPLAFRGENAGPSLWTFELQLDAGQRLTGKLAPGGEWRHDVQVEFSRLDRLVAALAESGEQALPDASAGGDVAGPSNAVSLPPMDARGDWRGSVQDGVLAGRFQLGDLQAGDMNVRGGAAMRLDGGDLTFRPQTMIGSGGALPGEIRLRGGVIRYADGRLRADRAMLEALGTQALVTGEWDLNNVEGEADITAVGTAAEGVVRYEAVVHAALKTPLGRPRITLDVRTDGATPAGRWDAQFNATARGPDWRQLQITLAAPRLTWSDDQGPIDLGDLVARGEWADGVARLTSLTLPNVASSSISALYETASGDWSVRAEIRGWTAPRAGPVPFDLAVDARRSEDGVAVESLRVERAGLEITGTGSFLPTREDPVQARLNLATTVEAESDASLPLPPGQWSSSFDVAGDASPLDLRLSGQLEARDVAVARSAIPYTVVPLAGRITEQLVTIQSEPFRLLEGEWEVGAQVRTREQLLTLRLGAGALPLQQVLDLFETPVEVGGELSAEIEAKLPGFDPEQLELSGNWNIGATGYRGVEIERGQGRLSFRRGVVRIEDIVLAQGPGQLTGTLEMNARDRRHLLFDLSSRNWPVAVKGTKTAIVLDSRATVDLDIVDLAGTGTIEGRGEVVVGDRQVGRMLVDATLNGRTIVASRILGQLPSGLFSGAATVPLDDWLHSSAEIVLKRVDLSELAAWGGIDDFITGLASGRITVGPSGTPRSPEPMQVGVSLEITGGRYRALTLGDIALTAFVGRDRMVLEHSRFEIAQGVAELWARFSRHENEPFLHGVITLQQLELNEFVQAANPDAASVVGRVSGRAALGGYVRHPHRAFGEGRLFLTQSDLANLPVVSLIYSVLNLQADNVPRGVGVMDLRLEGDTLEITRLQYFNRGADLLGQLEIENVWLFGESPVRGLAAGVVRPLRGVNLPLFPDLDRLLGALQSDAVSARIEGTLGDHRVRTVPFAEVSGAISRVLGITPDGQ